MRTEATKASRTVIITKTLHKLTGAGANIGYAFGMQKKY